MTYSHFLQFLLRGDDMDFSFEVREHEAHEVRSRVDSYAALDSEMFIRFRTVDGTTVMLNMMDVQAVRHYWNLAVAVTDDTISEKPLTIYLRGRPEPIEEFGVEPDQIFDLFSSIGEGPVIREVSSFIDEDGEPLYFRVREVVCATAPTQLVAEGRRIVAEQDQLPL